MDHHEVLVLHTSQSKINSTRFIQESETTQTTESADTYTDPVDDAMDM